MDKLTGEIYEELNQQYQNIKSDFLNKSKELQNIVVNNPESKIDEVLNCLSKESEDYIKVLSMKASILYEQAKISLGNDALNDSEKFLRNGMEIIMENIDHTQVTFLYLRIVNYLSYVLSRLDKLEEAKTLLESLLNTKIKCIPKVYSTENLFANSEIDEKLAKSKMDKLTVNNMQMLIWIYGKLGLIDSYFDMQHKCLQKELDINDGDPIQWAIRCYRLASLYLTKYDWKNARYYLTVAQVILDPLEVGMSTNPMLHKAQADLARVWVNYTLLLFGHSRKNQIAKRINEVDENLKLETSSNKRKNLRFTELVTDEPDISVTEIEESESAKALFLFTLKWLKRARLFYTLRDYPIQYVNIIFELSELYRSLAFYETDVDSQYNLQKKRYDTLESLSELLKDVKPNCYNAVSVQLTKDLVSVQIDLVNLNLKKLYNPSTEVSRNKDDLKTLMEAMIDINDQLEGIIIKENPLSSDTNTFFDQDCENHKEPKHVKTSDLADEKKGEGEGQL